MAYKLLWTTGFTLMALSAAIHGWSMYARDAGVQALEDARRRVSAAASNHEPSAPPPPAEPDTTTWSPRRIAAYRAALLEKHTPLALLRIPSLNLVVPVFEGTGEWALNSGVGRITGTARMAADGNLGIAGHRDGFFRPLRNIQLGDTLILEGIASSHHYRVTQLQIVEPTDIGVLQATPTPTLTLVTCYPFYYIGPAPQRFIVHAARINVSESLDQPPRVEQRRQAHEQHAKGADQR